MRFLLLSDTHGKLGVISELAAKVRADAVIHAERGDDDVARKDVHTATEIFEKLEGLLELGRALVVRGDDDDHDRARELFKACGATTDSANLN